jgi:hypothetical protein
MNIILTIILGVIFIIYSLTLNNETFSAELLSFNELHKGSHNKMRELRKLRKIYQLKANIKIQKNASDLNKKRPYVVL